MRTSRWAVPAITVVCAAAFTIVLSHSPAPSATVPMAAASASGAVTGPTTGPRPAVGIRKVHSPGMIAADLVLTPGQCHAVVIDAADGIVLPDPACTPGAVDPAVTEDTLSTTICSRGYTTTVRPPAAVTGPAKQASLADYNLPYSHTTEYDDLISLELGGANSISNLWPEPNTATARGVNNPKDQVENALNRAICNHTVTLTAAQTAIATNWSTAAQVLGLG